MMADYEGENLALHKLCRAYAAGETTEEEYRAARRSMIDAIERGESMPEVRRPPELGLVETTVPNPTGTIPALSVEAGESMTVFMRPAVPLDKTNDFAADGAMSPWLLLSLVVLLLMALAAMIVLMLI